MPAKFVLKKGSTGKFRFNLLATNGQVIATSESYESKAAAMRGIESVRKNASGAALDDQTAGAATKTAAKKTTAKKSTARKATAKKTTAKKTTAKKSTAKKATTRKSTAKKATVRATATPLPATPMAGVITPTGGADVLTGGI